VHGSAPDAIEGRGSYRNPRAGIDWTAPLDEL